MLNLMPTVHLQDRARFTVSGEDAAHFLQALITTDLDRLDPGVWKPGVLLTAQGKVQFAFLILSDGAGFVIEAGTEDATALAKRLGFYKLRSKVTINVPEPVELTVGWGSDVAAPADALKDARFADASVWRTASAQPASGTIDDWNRMRILHGVAEAQTDFQLSDVFAHDINLDQTGGLSFSKGCYVGQEVVSRMHHRNTARRRVMIAEGETALEMGAQVFAGSKPAGVIGTTSGTLGLALVRLDRIHDALQAGDPIKAGDRPVIIRFPEGVTFTWPQGAGDTE